MNKVVIKRNPWTVPTKEMVDWLIEKNPELKDGDIEAHNPLFVECVEELKPSDFRVVQIEGDEYTLIECENDVIILVPEDIEIIRNSFVKIPEEMQWKNTEQEEQQG